MEKLKKLWIFIAKLFVKGLKKLWILIVKLFGWRLILPEKGSRPEMDRCVFVVAPHTSSLDFFVGAAYLWSCCSNGGIFMKKELFHWSVKWLLEGLGAIAVDRGNGKMINSAVEKFGENESFSLAITPEATRGRKEQWTEGFWEIAYQAGVPIVPTYIDFKRKEIGAFEKIEISVAKGVTDEERRKARKADTLKIRKFYKKEMAKYPENFVEV